jgi:hypothetical protein
VLIFFEDLCLDRYIEQKTNDPRDLEPPQLGGGLNSNPEMQALNTPGPYIPSQEVTKNIGEPQVS